ncbi:uncharacterized protein METZ01_LOCUS471785, partial [marine metagenome]
NLIKKIVVQRNKIKRVKRKRKLVRN